MPQNEFQRQKRYIRDAQLLLGLTFEEAAERWRISGEIADTFLHDGIRTADEISEGEIQDAIDDYKAITRLGL